MGKHNQGFTLLELIIVVVILGITLAMAGPSLSRVISDNRVSTTANDFVAAMQFAKAESAARVTPVTLCKRSVDGTGCVGGGDWSQGWIVFADTNGDAGVTAGEVILLSQEALDNRIVMGGTNGVNTSITYRPAGTTSVTATEMITVCDDRGFDTYARGILVTITGRGNVMKAKDTGLNACL